MNIYIVIANLGIILKGEDNFNEFILLGCC